MPQCKFVVELDCGALGQPFIGFAGHWGGRPPGMAPPGQVTGTGSSRVVHMAHQIFTVTPNMSLNDNQKLNF